MVGRHRASFSSSGALSSGLTLAGKPDPSLVLRGRAGRHHGRVPAAQPGSLSAIAVQGAGRERAHPASPRRRDWHPQRPPDTRLGQNRGLRRHEGQRGCARQPGCGGNTGPGVRCPRGGKSLHFPSMEGGGVGGPWGREPRWAQPPVQGGHLGRRLPSRRRELRPVHPAPAWGRLLGTSSHKPPPLRHGHSGCRLGSRGGGRHREPVGREVGQGTGAHRAPCQAAAPGFRPPALPPP